jgi:mannonate dehydratase
MLFCQGCVTEMGVDVYEAIRDIASLGKIVYVHFRNVRGTPRNFQEVFLDEGDIDMFKAMQTYKDSGFEGPFMMDHTPTIPDSRNSREGLAFAVGYIRAMIQAVYR